MQWLNGDQWDWSHTNTSPEEFFGTGSTDSQSCFALDLGQLQYFVEEPCQSKLRRLCYHSSVSQIPRGEIEVSLNLSVNIWPFPVKMTCRTYFISHELL